MAFKPRLNQYGSWMPEIHKERTLAHWNLWRMLWLTAGSSCWWKMLRQPASCSPQEGVSAWISVWEWLSYIILFKYSSFYVLSSSPSLSQLPFHMGSMYPFFLFLCFYQFGLSVFYSYCNTHIYIYICEYILDICILHICTYVSYGRVM